MDQKTIFDIKQMFIREPGHYSLLKENGLEIFYAPFDYVNEDAEVAIVGITPGNTQFENSINAFQNAINEFADMKLAFKKTKNEASFSGAMRNNLIKMLDEIGLNKKLHIDSSASLFEQESSIAHFTSFCRYPAYFKGQPYNGSPNPLKNQHTLWFIENLLLPEIMGLKNLKYIIPVGKKVEEVMVFLSLTQPEIKQKLLLGLPHPSGANAERIAYFLGNKRKEDLSEKTNPDVIDLAKSNLLGRIKSA